MALFRREPSRPEPVVPPVDLDVPVTNPAVVAAVEALVADPVSYALSAALDQALRDAVFLAAGSVSEVVSDRERPGQGVVPAGSELRIHTAETEDGEELLALFTDWPSLEAFCGTGQGSFVLPAAEAFGMALSYDGAVVNPAGPDCTVPLPPDVLRRLLA